MKICSPTTAPQRVRFLLVPLFFAASPTMAAPAVPTHAHRPRLVQRLIRSIVARNIRRPVQVGSPLDSPDLFGVRPPVRRPERSRLLITGLLAAAVGGYAAARGPAENANWARLLLRTGIADMTATGARFFHLDLRSTPPPKSKGRAWLNRSRLNISSMILIDSKGRRAPGASLTGCW